MLEKIPKIPKTIRYLDGFSDSSYTIKNFKEDNLFVFVIYGNKVKFDFNKIGDDHRNLAKYLFFYWINLDLSVSTAYNNLVAIRDMDQERLTDIILAGPNQIRLEWSKLYSANLRPSAYRAIRSMLVAFCNFNVAGWSKLYLNFIGTSLPAPFQDKYAGIRNGDVFLSAHEESLIVSYLDDIAVFFSESPQNVTDEDLDACCMLMISYLYGMRPLQIALLTMRDVRIFRDENDDVDLSVGLTFKMIKQKRKSMAFPLTHRVKREWSPLIVGLYRRALARGLSGEDRLFAVLSNSDAGVAIQDLASRIVGCNVSAMDLRHTAAQRLVDSGASQEEVATFLGHSDISTCLVYFTSSPNQAELVNKALGISPVYQKVIQIAHDRIISRDELSKLKGDQQIGGVPHGIPIAGIGGCGLGQPNCPYNPITSCYGCKKFMPVNDVKIHRMALNDMRTVVKKFFAHSVSDDSNPTYMQLMRTIANIQAIIDELESGYA